MIKVSKKWDILAERIAHEVQLRELKEAAVEKERQIQATEYARRLNELNHVYERAEEAQKHTVPREVFDNHVRESSEKNEFAIKNLTLKYDAGFTALENKLQEEREIRKSFEGSLSSWKWLAGFLGLSGLGSILVLILQHTS